MPRSIRELAIRCHDPEAFGRLGRMDLLQDPVVGGGGKEQSRRRGRELLVTVGVRPIEDDHQLAGLGKVLDSAQQLGPGFGAPPLTPLPTVEDAHVQDVEAIDEPTLGRGLFMLDHAAGIVLPNAATPRPTKTKAAIQAPLCKAPRCHAARGRGAGFKEASGVVWVMNSSVHPLCDRRGHGVSAIFP